MTYIKDYDIEYIFRQQELIRARVYDLLKLDYTKLKDIKEIEKEIEYILKMAMDCYTFDKEGRSLITDMEYDRLMEIYVLLGNDRITTSDYPATTWNIVKHTVPFMVGSINKTYSLDELMKYVISLSKDYRNVCVSPKFDGISTVITLKNGKIVQALTRKDGVYGQDITKLVQKSKYYEDKNFKPKKFFKGKDGYIKCELVISTEDFEELTKYKEYRNRRSATSGVVNSPKNLEYGKYITIIPLYYVDKSISNIVTIAPYMSMYETEYPREIIGGVQTVLDAIRLPSFQYRCDGVVIFPMNSKSQSKPDINTIDLLQDGLAYKINTKYAITWIDSVYASVGRTGKVTPMAKVVPCEVNETTISDISLSNMKKFQSFNIHEHEEIEIYSAGDVIPMLNRATGIYPEGAKRLLLDGHCPYCGEVYNIVNGDLYCTNKNCIRIITGKIINFIDKIGIKDISNKTIESLYEAGLVKDIQDLFDLTVADIEKIDGFNTVSATNICREINRIQYNPIDIGTLIGSLGIKGISRKRAQIITVKYSIDDLCRFVDQSKSLETLSEQLSYPLDKIGSLTLLPLLQFLKNDKNRQLLYYLKSIMNITNSVDMKKTICFTGFRNKELERAIEDMGYSYTNNLTKDTLLLVTINPNATSSKVEKALKYGIRIVSLTEFMDMIDKKELE